MSNNPGSVALVCTPDEAEELNRRQFLQGGVALTAFASLANLLQIPTARAQSGESFPPQRKLVWINLGGGWDILEATDPKVASTSGIDQIYEWSAAQALAGSASGDKIGRWLPRIAAIGADVVVVRGLAMGTTSHMAGSVYMDTGILSNAGRVNAASIPAIVASESTATIPIIQLNGGSDPQIDRGLLKPVSVVRASNLDLYRAMYPTTSDEIQRRLMMLDYMKSSLTRLKDEVGASDRFTALSAAQDKITVQLQDNVGAKLVLTNADRAPFVNTGTGRMDNGMGDAFALANKLIQSDLVTSVNLGMGGFDTHAGQSVRLEPILTNLDTMVRALVDQLRASGKLDTTLIVLYSDFGRTPKINNSNGRDHWPVSGAMMIGGGIAGGRVVGATNDSLLAESINPTTGLVDAAGTQLNPTHLGGAVLELTLGTGYSKYRPYLASMPALTRLKS